MFIVEESLSEELLFSREDESLKHSSFTICWVDLLPLLVSSQKEEECVFVVVASKRLNEPHVADDFGLEFR